MDPIKWFIFCDARTNEELADYEMHLHGLKHELRKRTLENGLIRLEHRPMETSK